ncbi:MAG: hypothetical protein ABF695_12280 [Liquorilactobacillus ghanensis]|uniref:hypothetical protein n=1 Tax=Liquorilactobacillus ghanensis TaxID=399370 RepID=UPI0039ED4BCC
MEIKANSINYELDQEGVTTVVSIGLYGRDDTGQYVNATVKVLPTDTEKSLDSLSKDDLVAIAKPKLIKFVSGNAA